VGRRAKARGKGRRGRKEGMNSKEVSAGEVSLWKQVSDC